VSGLLACDDTTTDLAALRALRVEGRVYDAATDSGVPDVEVGVVSNGGSSGLVPITTGPAISDATGAYSISEDFAIDLLCTAGAWFLAVNLPDGWRLVPGGEPLQCTEATQMRDVIVERDALK
jgi:hypothetical protein